MYETINFLHAWGRWIVSILILLVLFKSLTGWLSKKPFEKSDNTASLLLMIFCDIQLLLGLVLYIWLSPVTKAALSDMGASMKDAAARFWAVEHITGMLIALILVHIGRSKSKKGETDLLKHKRLFIFTLIAFVIMMAVIPWPGSAAARSLFPI